MRLSLISDEVSQSLSVAAEFAHKFDLQALELRSVQGTNIFSFTDEQARETARLMQGEGLAVSCLSAPLFKFDISDDGARAACVESFKRALDHCALLGCSLIRGFAFLRPADGNIPYFRIAEAYHGLLPLLEGTDVTICLESDPTVNGRSAAELVRCLRAIDSPRVQAVWDPGNLLFVPEGEDAQRSFDLLRSFIRHVHVKDAVRLPEGGARAVKIGTGEADTALQMRLLSGMGYKGWMSLETHYRLDRALDETLIRLPGGAEFSDGGYSAGAESMLAWLPLVQSATV
ncbi:MAG: sugar phosphate isomerase/epimerase family protein [Eubacteriales bacterium]|nr:sugar phosphate isomerase/epimerase family protein [Eubacteriales bacterium]